MFGFIKKIFVVAMTFFSCNALKCVSMNNQECKIRLEKLEINNNYPVIIDSILIVLKQINAMTVVIRLMIHIQNYVFLMLLKT